MSESNLTQPRLATAVDTLTELAREKTPARIFADRTGGSYLTPIQLQLRADHAVAKDAVQTELCLDDFGNDFVEQHRLFLVQTAATSKAEFLLRPDLGRRLSAEAREQIRESIRRLPPLPRDMDEGTIPQPKPGDGIAGTSSPRLQIVIGDGLSATAVRTQAPGLLPLLIASAQQTGWTVGRAFVIRYCRVGVLNDLGELLQPDVIVLLIGERPGLATAESLSAYMAFGPRAGDTDAQRNLISNIHSRGVSHEAAVVRILDLAKQMIDRQTSGVAIKELLPGMQARSALLRG